MLENQLDYKHWDAADRGKCDHEGVPNLYNKGEFKSMARGGHNWRIWAGFGETGLQKRGFGKGG